MPSTGCAAAEYGLGRRVDGRARRSVADRAARAARAERAQPLRVVLGPAPADAGLLNDGLETVVFSKDGLDGAGADALPGVLQELHRRGVRHLRGRGRAPDRALLPRSGTR